LRRGWRRRGGEESKEERGGRWIKW
jgi:hypothetical protein